MSRVMTRTGPTAGTSGTLLTVWTVPADHKYELVNVAFSLANVANLVPIGAMTNTTPAMNIFKAPAQIALAVFRLEFEGIPFFAGEIFGVNVLGGAGNAFTFQATYIDVTL